MRHFTSILALLLVCNAFAIDKETAQKVAQTVLGVSTKADSKSDIVLLWDGIQTKSEGDPAFYVFGRPEGGFAIVSAHESACPVLGYSFSDRFDPHRIPENLMGLLLSFQESIREAREAQIPQSNTAKASWNLYLSGESSVAGEEKMLETAQWNQGVPYNRFCPEVDGQRTFAGCTNTAMAIVMRYHKWPEYGIGSLSSYQDLTGKWVEGHTLGHPYEWDKMPLGDLLKEGYTEQERDRIAQLIYDLAIMNRSNFGLASTGAGVNIPEFVARFNYDPAIQRILRSRVANDETWEQLIREEIRASRPVLFAALLDDAGHRMVIDGFKGRFFHINLGWGGFMNTFMRITPFDDEYSQVTFSYKSWQDIIIHIKPADNPSPAPLTAVSVYFPDGFPYRTDTHFTGMVEVENYNLSEQTQVLALGVVDSKNHVDEIISLASPFSIKALESETFMFSCVIHTTLRAEHSVRLCIQNPDGSWTPLVSTPAAIYPMTHSQGLFSLCQLLYSKQVEDKENWERLIFYLPMTIGFEITDENGNNPLYQPDDDYPVYYIQEEGLFFSHYQSTPSKTYTIRLFDLLKEETMEITF